MVFAVVFGMGNGLLSIVSGTLPLHLFGSNGYGRLQGKMMAARLILSALAPFVLALSMAKIGIPASLAMTVPRWPGGADVPGDWQVARDRWHRASGR